MVVSIIMSKVDICLDLFKLAYYQTTFESKMVMDSRVEVDWHFKYIIID